MLWQIKGSRLSLLASVHLLDAPVPPLSAEAWSAFAAATRVVLEHDPTQIPDLSFAQLKPGESLSSVIPASLYVAVENRCREWSIDIGWVARFQPWFVGLRLGVEVAKRHGLDHDNGVDKVLLAQARVQGKAIEFLETPLAALATFGLAPVDEQHRMLRNAALDPERGIEFLTKMVAGWKARRADVILECIRERLTQMPIMFANLIEGRNRAWLPRLMTLARDEVPTLVVVGVLHMVGPNGLADLLRRSGLEVAATDVAGE
jgi:uncharacterized protein YbaP (TraB family)